jgi:hypothetical protein
VGLISLLKVDAVSFMVISCAVENFGSGLDIDFIRGSCGKKALTFFIGHRYTGRFIMFSEITNIYNKKTKGPTLMELFTATRKVKKLF